MHSLFGKAIMNISICRAMSIKETEQLCAPITRIGDYPGWGYVMVDCLMILLLHNIIASVLLEDLVSLTCLLLLELFAGDLHF